MPPKTAKGAESKQGLVITIVFLVLLVIGLGVTAYYGFAGQADKEKAASDAKAHETTMAKTRDWEKFKALLLQAYIGYDMTDENKTDLAVLRDKFDANQLGTNEPDRSAVAALVTKLDTKQTSGLGWDPANKKPVTTYADLVKSLKAKIGELENTLATTQANDAVAMDKEKRARETAEAARSQVADKLREAEESAAAEVKKNQEQFAKWQEDIEKLNSANLKYQEEAKAAQGDLSKQITKLTKENKNEQMIVDKLRDAAAPKIDATQYAQPQGKIVSLDERASTAYINLGSADNVKQQLTFSVFGVSPDGKMMKERKAALEVVNVLEPHLSAARITQVRDPNRDPVLTGDLIMNPAWSPTLKQHVAIAGLIDLTGEGTDNTQEFIRNLERQNIVVDAYLDLKDVAIKGKGMTPLTTYLIVGDNPQLDEALALKEGSASGDRLKDIIAKLSQMKEEASKEGITTIPYRRFLALIGYRLPRSVAPADYSKRGGLEVSGGTPAAPK